MREVRNESHDDTRTGIRTSLRKWIVPVLIVLSVWVALADQSPTALFNNTLHAVGIDRTNELDSYSFVWKYPKSNEPLRWPACITLTYFVNPTNAPHNALPVLRREFSYLHRVTGYNFAYGGASKLTNTARYARNGVKDTVLIVWTSPQKISRTVELNALTTLSTTKSPLAYYAAGIAFNDTFNKDFATNADFAENLTLHEIAHLVGLADVHDPTQIMNETLGSTTSQTTFGRGDLRGLKLLSYPACTK